MKLWLDTADAAEIADALDHGISGVTTNPSLLAKTGRPATDVLNEIAATFYWREIPLSVELMATHYAAQCAEAQRIHRDVNYQHFVFKVPIAWDNLRFCSIWPANVTAVMSYAQAILAADAGAKYVSIFSGRISDIGGDAAGTIRQVRETFDRANSTTEIVVGSIRHQRDVVEALQAGAHIVTVPPAILKKMCDHPQTDVMVAQFTRDAERGYPQPSPNMRNVRF